MEGRRAILCIIRARHHLLWKSVKVTSERVGRSGGDELNQFGSGKINSTPTRDEHEEDSSKAHAHGSWEILR